MDATMKARMQLSTFLGVHFLEITLADDTIVRVMDGSIADVAFSSMTFTRQHGTYGTLVVPESFTDGVGAEAPHLAFGILPPSNAAAAALAAAAMQGCAVRFWLGIVDEATGAIVGTPDLQFTGYVDVPTILVGRDRIVRFDAFTDFELFFEQDEGRGLNPGSHKDAYPTELAFDFVMLNQRRLGWGTGLPRPDVITDTQVQAGGSFGGGGGGMFSNAIRQLY